VGQEVQQYVPQSRVAPETYKSSAGRTQRARAANKNRARGLRCAFFLVLSFVNWRLDTSNKAAMSDGKDAGGRV
jgi:hypothetical protein